MIGMLRTPDDERWYRRSIVALILGCWIVLAAWGASPYAGLLDHGNIGEGGIAAVARVPAFVVGWVLMTIAMMLPGSLPLVNLFRRFVAGRADRSALLARLLLGYLAVWAGFGVLAYLGDIGLHTLVARSATAEALAARGAIAFAIVLIAGIYQFTPLKYQCLEQCRSPYSFLAGNWRGNSAGMDALRLGARHGWFCLGCCWSLMLLMFAIAGLNLGWMLGLGAVMALERSTAWGRRLTRPLGITLILWAPLFLILPLGG